MKIWWWMRMFIYKKTKYKNKDKWIKEIKENRT